MSITIKDLSKRFGRFTALDHVSLEVPTGSLVALLGPSGSGKTTLLRIIAGLEMPDGGSILYRGEDVTGQPARERNMGFVFQHYALFRSMTVFENVAFGLRVRHRPEAEIRARVRELLRLVRLEGHEKRLPSQLSGGQRQRVALARALAPQPTLLLLDEPFGALDARVRQDLRQWLRRLHHEIGMTSVFVTHDQEEAFEVADKIVILRAGQIEQTGTPQELFDHPATPFVMDFLGQVNVFHGRVQQGRAVLGALEVDYPDYPHDHSLPATAYVRPHELEIARTRNGVPALEARVVHVHAAGSIARVHLEAADYQLPLHADLSLDRHAELALRAGDTVFVSARRVRVFLREVAEPPKERRA